MFSASTRRPIEKYGWNPRNIVVPSLSEVEPLGQIAGDGDLFTDYLIG